MLLYELECWSAVRYTRLCTVWLCTLHMYSYCITALWQVLLSTILKFKFNSLSLTLKCTTVYRAPKMRPSSASAGVRRRRRAGTRPSTAGLSNTRSAASNFYKQESLGKLRKDRHPLKKRPATSSAYQRTISRFARESAVLEAQKPSSNPVEPSLSHPVLDQLNSRLDLKNIDFILRTRGVRPTSAVSSMRRKKSMKRYKRPSTASDRLSYAHSSPLLRETQARRRPNSSHVNAVTASFANSAKAYTWRYMTRGSEVPSRVADSFDEILSGSETLVPRGSARAAGRWRRFQKLQTDVYHSQNLRAAQRLEECHKAKANLWPVMDKFVDIMKRGAESNVQKREQAHRMFVALSTGFAGTEDPLITLPQMLSRICTFGYNWWEVEPILKRMFVAFDSDLDGLVDWRDIIVALRVAVQPLEPHDARLKRFFNVYSDESNYMDRRTLIHMMTVTLHSSEATERVAAVVDTWLNSMQPPLPGLHRDHFMELVAAEWEIAQEEWRTCGPAKSMVEIDSFLGVMWHDWFSGMSPAMRLRIADQRQQASLDIISAAETRIKTRAAVKWWQRNKLAKVWKQFKYGLHLFQCDYRAALHCKQSLERCGLRAWHKWARGSSAYDLMKNSAQAFRMKWFKIVHFGHWKVYWQVCRRRDARHLDQAMRWYRSWTLDIYFTRLRKYWKRRLQKYEAIAFWHKLEKRNLFRTWRDNVQYSRRTRKAADTLAEIRGDVFFGKAASIEKEAEDLKRSIKEEYERKAAEEAARLAEIEHQKDLWAEQKMAAWEKGENRRKKRIQDEIWRKEREEAERRDRRKEIKMWEKMDKYVEADAEFEAYQFLRTPMGKELLRVRTLQVRKEGGLREDQVANGLDTELEEGMSAEEYNSKVLIEAMTKNAEFVKLFDPLLNEAFFYNCRNGERLTADDLSYEEAESIAIEVYVKEQVKKALATSNAKQKKDIQDRKERAAAVKINNFMRSSYHKKYLRKLFLQVYCVQGDPTTGQPYYVNTWTGQSRWNKPVALRNVKMHLPEYILMKDPESGTPFYRQTIKPHESVWEKPKGWLLCADCREDFAARRCLECEPEVVLCINCYTSRHPNPAVVEGADPDLFAHKFKKLPIIAHYCTMCKNKLADKLCVECGCEQYCDRCFEMMHGKSRRKKSRLSMHSDIILL